MKSPLPPAFCHRNRENWTCWIRAFRLRGWNKRRTGSGDGKGGCPSRPLTRHNTCKYGGSFYSTTVAFAAGVDITPWAGFLSMGDFPHPPPAKDLHTTKPGQSVTHEMALAAQHHLAAVARAFWPRRTVLKPVPFSIIDIKPRGFYENSNVKSP